MAEPARNEEMNSFTPPTEFALKREKKNPPGIPEGIFS